MRTSWSPACARIDAHAPSMSVMCVPGLAPGMTQRLPGLGGRASRTRTADGDKWTVRAPVFPSTMRISALSRSTCSQRRVRISFRRQPVSISKRIVAIAPTDSRIVTTAHGIERGAARGKRLVVMVGQKTEDAVAVRNSSRRRRWLKLEEWQAGETGGAETGFLAGAGAPQGSSLTGET